jgi:hypothetical protein
MARAIWSGMLSFGLVSVPVQLYSATEAHGPTFHQFEGALLTASATSGSTSAPETRWSTPTSSGEPTSAAAIT